MVDLVITKNIAPTPCCAGIWHMLAGILMIVLGTYVWFNPFISLMALSLYIGVALIVIGAGYVASSMSLESGWFMFVGVIDVIIGIILVSNLGVSAVTLPIIFALWSIAVGSVQLVSSYHLSKAELPWGWSLSLGLLGIVFGFLILQYPELGAVTISTLLGLYIVLYGILEIVEYFYFKNRTIEY
ncbi:MAG: DUF308 domain-containing protein [Alphaproteobacteria bacterium]|nr:DUF308 domain-containing protein [Alphaproteobacteria bacterium]